MLKTTVPCQFFKRISRRARNTTSQIFVRRIFLDRSSVVRFPRPATLGWCLIQVPLYPVGSLEEEGTSHRETGIRRADPPLVS